MLHIHRSERADGLVQALAEILAEPPGDPFAPEVVSVPTRGMERWLTQQLSVRLGTSAAGLRDGVCANVRFPPPGAVLGDALSVAGGVDPATDPWPASRLVWHLLQVVDARLQEPWLAPLAVHLADGHARRFARLRAVARLFSEYGLRRPSLIQAWAAGEFDNTGAGAWQPQLWLAVREAIAIPSPAERLPEACARLLEEPELIDLPPRLTLFGPTRLPAMYLQALAALAAGRDVHLMLLHPSPSLWADPGGAVPLDSATAAATGSNPNRLLTSWGREIRELQTVLSELAHADHHHPLPGNGSREVTLLRAIQADITQNRQPPGPPLPGVEDQRLLLAAADSSIRIHACHGRARQVEVLREAILHRLQDDPTLEPRDVIVMCPDIESFAPLIEATFGAGAQLDGAEPDATALRVRLADRSLRQTNPILGVVARLLELPDGRLTASEVLDLADRAPVRRRFQFDDDDLAQLREWIGSAGVHWGLDAKHRDTYHLANVETGTWEFGLRRILLGVTMADTGSTFDRVLPLDDVTSDGIELTGRLAELIDRLGWVLRALSGPMTLRGWAQALSTCADLLTDTAEREPWQRGELDRMLEEIVEQAAGSQTELTLPEIRALLSDRLAGRPTRANFRTGHLTVCTLMPMRSVPHRVVCLLGLDDGVFPRQTSRDGDNLLLRERRPGDRDPRAEDRQLLLDGLMSAQETLIVTYSGNDERTNAVRPPAVPVGELLDAIEATARTDDPASGSARDRVVVHHPLQPFDPRNFAERRPWSFDRVELAGARAFAAPRTHPEPFLPEPLPTPQEGSALQLTDLIAFLQRPARAFLRQRLGVTMSSYEDEVDDSLPVALDGLESWAIGQRLLEALMDGADERSAYLPEIARGALPPGMLGQEAIGRMLPAASRLAARALAAGGGEQPRSFETNVVLADGTRLTGTVSGVRGAVALSVSYSRLNARQRMAAWVQLLALSAAHPELPFEAVTIGRSGNAQAPVAVARVPRLDQFPVRRAEIAVAELTRLAELRRHGLMEPLALPAETAATYARAESTGADAVAAARDVWESGWRNGSRHRGEHDGEPEHTRIFGHELPADQLARHGQSVWGPLLARETLES